MIGTGTCAYCGQQRMVTCTEYATGSELNRRATAECCCEKALDVRSAEHIPERIRGLFGDECKAYGFEHPCSGAALQTLVCIAMAVLEDELSEAKVKLGCGDMAVFKLGADGDLEIWREMKRKRTL